MTMYLFIDTNILLSFYHLTNEDLEELDKLAVLIQNEEIDLIVTEQLRDETRRNRARRLKDSFEPFRKLKLNVVYPAYCKGYQQYEQLRLYQKAYDKTHSELVNAIHTDIQKRKLRADLLIEELFQAGKLVRHSPELTSKAQLRSALGNPPGKPESLGDALHWEALLEKVPNYNKLTIVSDDADYASPLDPDKIGEFLEAEWKEKKSSPVLFYRRLSSFFSVHYPNINLTEEKEKDAWVSQLASSGSFEETHRITSTSVTIWKV